MVKPERKYLNGSVSASVWLNERMVNGEKKMIHSVTLEKSYKDKDGNWKSTRSLSVNDLPKAMSVLSKAYSSLAVREE